jgi:hypothetical protein
VVEEDLGIVSFTGAMISAWRGTDCYVLQRWPRCHRAMR